MARRTRTEAEKRQLVAAWRRSGVPKTRFAQDRGLPASAFARWIARFDTPTELLPTFTTVEVIPDPPAPLPPPLIVQVAGRGHRIEVPAGFDVGELRRLLGVLC